MKKHLVVAIFLSTLSTIQSAQSQHVEVEPGLEGFITAITDPDSVRHYALASKQAAIHKWLIKECMESRGLQGDSLSNSVEWHNALHGEYAHCEDHHIPGIDPPCPAENVVRAASDRSCWSVAKRQIDWSHAILHRARQGQPERARLFLTDDDARAIESHWSKCMKDKGLEYKNRFEMMKSHDPVLDAARYCFEDVHYYEEYGKLYKRRLSEHYSAKRRQMMELFARYEAAEHEAESRIRRYCEEDRERIIDWYELDRLSQETICIGR